MVSEAQKKARDKWDRKNMAQISCKLKKEKEYKERFQEYAKEQGKTVNALLTEYIVRCIGE